VASLGAFPDRELTIIVGGADRGVDPTGLLQALAHRRPAPRVMVLPPDPQGLADRLASLPAADGPAPVVEVALDLEDAVRRAVSVTPAGGVVLFSPAAPTPEGEGGYGERSRRFVDAAGLSDAT
jgi:UDP-N-acetylmuramoyl-L-alanine---L-glutamate ligase